MPSYTQAVLSPDPLYLQTKSYDARSDRKALQDLINPGVLNSPDFLVTFVSGMTVQIAAGVAYVLGQNIADQGIYRQYVASSSQLTVTAANGSNPRIDQVILRVLDAAADSNTSGAYECRIEIVPGTPTAGATLANRSGAANLTTLLEQSKSVLLLADILVGTGVTNLSSGVIGDKRVLAYQSKAARLPRIPLDQFATLPAQPDGQEIILQVDPANGINWHLAYNLGSTAPKWEFVGGPPLVASVLADEATVSASYTNLTTDGPIVNVPRAGDYIARWGVFGRPGAGSQAFVSLGGIVGDGTDEHISTVSAGESMSSETLLSGLTAGNIKLRYHTNGGSPTASFKWRHLAILPRRIS